MIQRVSKRLFLLAALVALAFSVIVPLSTPKAESKAVGRGTGLVSGGLPLGLREFF